MTILEKYNYRLPVISNWKTNGFLKIIADIVGININLTTHRARHTCAVLLLNRGMRYEVVSRWLGHSNPKITTEIYAKVLKKTVLSEFMKIQKK